MAQSGNGRWHSTVELRWATVERSGSEEAACAQAGRRDLPAFRPGRSGEFQAASTRRGAGRMEVRDMDRRTLLKGGGAAFAGLTVLQVAGPAHAFPGEPGEEEVLPWLGPAPPSLGIPNLFWIGSSSTPGSRRPTTSSLSATTTSPTSMPADWRLRIGGLVAQDAVADAGRPQGAGRVARWTSPWSARATTASRSFIGAVGNARWAGAPLAPILKEAGRPEGGHRGRLLGG